MNKQASGIRKWSAKETIGIRSRTGFGDNIEQKLRVECANEVRSKKIRQGEEDLQLQHNRKKNS